MNLDLRITFRGELLQMAATLMIQRHWITWYESASSMNQIRSTLNMSRRIVLRLRWENSSQNGCLRLVDVCWNLEVVVFDPQYGFASSSQLVCGLPVSFSFVARPASNVSYLLTIASSVLLICPIHIEMRDDHDVVDRSMYIPRIKSDYFIRNGTLIYVI